MDKKSINYKWHKFKLKFFFNYNYPINLAK